MTKTATIPRTSPYDLSSIPVAVLTDHIFFSKFNVKTGTRFRHYGRKSYGTTWVVHNITTITSGKYGRLQHSIPYVRTLSDIIHVHCVETGEWRTLRFMYMSYSAIWRLDD